MANAAAEAGLRPQLRTWFDLVQAIGRAAASGLDADERAELAAEQADAYKDQFDEIYDSFGEEEPAVFLEMDAFCRTLAVEIRKAAADARVTVPEHPAGDDTVED